MCAACQNITIPDDKLGQVAYYFLLLIKLFALTHKHDGFKEEREWRIIYLPERDPKGILGDCLKYANGSRGVEPKLKLKIEPLNLEVKDHWTFDTILEKIILGPSNSSFLAVESVKRMMQILKCDELKSKVRGSRIPLRPIQIK